MRRLNVQQSQIEECIRLSMFAVDMLPVNPPLQRGEELLLQLVKADAVKLGLESKRVQFALVFDHAKPDPTGEISSQHWPLAGKTWKYILYCSDTIPTIPFSLERLPLGRDYQGQTNPIFIQPDDEALIRGYLKAPSPTEELTAVTTLDDLLLAIHNYDTIVQLSPRRTTIVAEHKRRLHDPWLGDALKSLYMHRCQICLHDFRPRYGLPYANTRFLTPLDRGGAPVSKNLVVICPNHDAIIGAAHATFDARGCAFQYPNGLVEPLELRSHLVN